jgi:multiple sugar transport system substrate-binding protein
MFVLLITLLFVLVGIPTLTAADKPKITLTFWDMVWGPPEYPETGKKLASSYSKVDPNVTVAYQPTQWTQYVETFTTAVASRTAPDCSTGADGQAFRFYTSGDILVLDSIIDQWKKEGKMSDFIPVSVEVGRYDNHQIAVPYNTHVMCLWYNKDIFKSAGIATLPKTWEEFIAAGKKVKSLGKDFFAWPAAIVHGSYTFLGFVRSAGSGIVDKDENVIIGDEGNRKTLEFFKKLYDEGLFPKDIWGYDIPDVRQSFSQGRTAVIFDQLDDSIKSLGVDHVALLPPMKGPKYAFVMRWAPHFLMAYKQTKYPDETKKFIKWWVENNLTMYTEGHHTDVLPIWKSWQKNPYFMNDPFDKFAMDVLMPSNVPPMYPRTSNFPEMNGWEDENIYAFGVKDYCSGKPIDDVLREMKEKMIKIMSARKGEAWAQKQLAR